MLLDFYDEQIGALVARLEAADAKLPDLPVPERFRQLFRDWADGKVDFMAPVPRGARHGL
jgi:hypothetical protein